MVIISIIGNLYRKIIFILIIKLILFHLYESLKRNLQALWDYELLSGLRTQLSPYFRILFHIVETIDNNRIIDEKLKYELIKDVRVMLSSQEQILLLLNSLTSFGEKWNEKI